jgi:hypothetical protein
MKDQKLFFVFDVESIGLHGEGFAVAGGIYDEKGKCVDLSEFCYSCPPGNAQGIQEDRDWVHANVPSIEITHDYPKEVRFAFWKEWKKAKKAGAIMFAECGWPVEARFLCKCIDDHDPSHRFDGPYPFHEISTVMACAGMDPMATYERIEGETSVHNPMCDVRQSARLLSIALKKLKS